MENEYDFSHLCSTEGGSSGSPIFSLTSNKVIGIHKQSNNTNNFNFGSFIKLSVREFINKNINNINHNTNNNANNNISDNKIHSMYDDFHKYYEKEDYENIPTILIENHSTYCRAGFVYKKKNNENIIKETKIYPFKYNTFNFYDDIMIIYDNIFQELNTDNFEHSILVLDDRIDMKKQGLSFIENMFDYYNFREISIIKPYFVQTCYYMYGTGVTIEIGEKVKCIPIYDYFPLRHAIKEYNFNLVKYIMDKFAKSGDIYMKTVNKNIVIDILKKICNQQNNLEIDYELPDGNHIILDKYLKEEIIEEFFDDYYFVNCLADSFEKCDIDIQKDLFKSQLFTGEYSFISNFKNYYEERKIYNKFKEILKKNYTIPNIISGSYDDEDNNKYFFANLMTMLPYSVVTNEEYKEGGVNGDNLRRKFFYNV